MGKLNKARTRLARYIRARRLSYEAAAEELRRTTRARCTGDYLGMLARNQHEPSLALARKIAKWTQRKPATGGVASLDIADLITF